MRYLLFVIIFFSGCAFKEPQYRYVSIERCSFKPWHDRGVFEVELPDYFMDDRFVYKKGEEVGYLEERLARDPQSFLSECAARELGACLYPWGCDKRPKELYHIKIEDFYYDKKNNRVVLMALVNHSSYKVVEPVQKDPIDAAIRAYKKLLAQIGK